MEQKTTALIILFAVLGTAVFGAGTLAGVFIQSQKTGSASAVFGGFSNSSAQKLADGLKSKAISSIVILGKVESAAGKSVKILSNGDSVSVAMTDKTTYFVADSPDKKITKRGASFGDIKAGDSLNISARVSGDNLLSAASVVIFPALKRGLE